MFLRCSLLDYSLLGIKLLLARRRFIKQKRLLWRDITIYFSWLTDYYKLPLYASANKF
jgi:hypothetical protein